MARTVTWDELRDLAAFEAEKGCAISLYLDLDPSLVPTAGDAATRLNSLLDEGARTDGANRRELTHDQRQALKADFERIRRFFGAEFSRNGAHGIAVFCAGLDNVWRPLPLTETVDDEIKIGQWLYLAPLVPLVGRGEGALVVVVSREQGQIYRLEAGRLEEVADHFEEQPRRHDQGGWSQSRFQRHVDELAQEHLRRVADEVDRLARRLRWPRIVVAASEETWSEFSPAPRPGDPQRRRGRDERRGARAACGAARARHAGARALARRARARGRRALARGGRPQRKGDRRLEGDARGRLGRPRRAAPLPGRRRAAGTPLPRLRSRRRRGEQMPARRHEDGGLAGRASISPCTRRSRTAARSGRSGIAATSIPSKGSGRCFATKELLSQ